MPKYQFAGHPKYLEAAAVKLGYSIYVTDRARRQPAVGECANLLSQVLDAHPAARREMLDHAHERVFALAVAHEAAKAMYDEVRDVVFPPVVPDPVTWSDNTELTKPARHRKATP